MRFQDYRSVLKDELENRCKRNPRYSLRAFARDLNLNAARLSEVLNGKVGLSRESAEQLARRIGFNDDETEQFADLVESNHARSKVKRELARIRLLRHQSDDDHRLQEDSFRLISDWYHYAILELTAIESFQSNPSWIARSLAISETEAKSAIERLERLNLLETKDGKLKATSGFTTTTNGVPSESIRQLHSQLLKKAEAALLNPIERRDFSSITMAVDASRIDEVKAKLRSFRRELMSDLDTGPKNSVYNLSIQFFELTTPQEETNS